MEELLRQAQSDPELSRLLQSLPPDKIEQLLQDFQSQSSNKSRVEGELDEEGGMLITPEKGYVLKASDARTKEKVFINVCSHPAIQAPAQQDLPDTEDAVGLRVPISLGPPRPDHDKKGGICTVFDVIVNPDVLSASKKDPVYRQLLVELSFNYIAQKHGRELDPKYRMPKNKYKGKTVQQQRVRGKKAPQIQVVDSEVFKEPIATGPSVPQWEVLFDNEPIDPELLEGCTTLTIVIELPLLVSSRGISLKVSPERLELSVGKLYQLGLWLPKHIDPSQTSAVFEAQPRILRVTMPAKEVEVETKSALKLEPIELSSHSMLYDVV